MTRFPRCRCRIAAEYRQHSQRTLEDPDAYLANPINAYLLVKKFTTDWYGVVDLIRNKDEDGWCF